ncbi:MFS transporter [Comamonas flocculans]|uniref:MFS transporter n=1 Tax=Comamonas flocculans TaxID=2597701 RepID=A0A5B8RWR2_9BURK|nr:MFS transporter [Comamonas flocculans]QEA13154.1 MFS transporter [Comamonas flocculans]
MRSDGTRTPAGHAAGAWSHGMSAFRVAAPVAWLLVLLSALLIGLRIEQVMLEFAQSRSLRTAQRVSDQIAFGYRLGLGLHDQTQLPVVLARQGAQDTELVGGWVATGDGEVVAELGQSAGRYAGALHGSWTARLMGSGNHADAPVASLVRQQGAQMFVGTALLDPSGHRAGVLWLVYDLSALRAAAWSVIRPLWPYALAVGMLLSLALGGIGMAWALLTGRRLRQAGSALGAAEPEDALHLPELERAAPGGRRAGALLAAAMLLSFAALTLLAWQGRQLAKPLLLEQIDRNARSVLSMAQEQVQRALSLGIPADRLVGVDAMLQAELETAPEVAFLAWQSSPDSAPVLVSQTRASASEAARALAAAGEGDTAFRLVRQTVTALAGGGAAAGSDASLSSGTTFAYIDARVRAVLIDLAFAILVGLVLAREMLGATWQRSVLKPYLDFSVLWAQWCRQARRLRLQADVAHRAGTQRLHDWWQDIRQTLQDLAAQAASVLRGEQPNARAMALTRIRLLVFLTALSDELLRPFFTVFASEMQPPGLAISPTTVAVLPVATFMLTLALAQPLGPWLARRVAMRWALFLSSLAGAALLLATAWAQDAATLMLLRAGSGLAYGLLLILAQTAIVRLTDSRSRGRGLVEVAAAIVAAGVCGPALGGLLVQRLGTTLAFAACALCLGMAALVSISLPRLQHESSDVPPALGWRGMAAILRNRQVMAVTWYAAVPARLAAVALLVVVTPLYLQAQGESAAVSGRVLLAYFLAFMIVAPLVARWSDLSGQRRSWVVWGCALSALACGLMVLVGGAWGAALCCALLGVAQAFQSAPQLVLVTEAFEASSAQAQGASLAGAQTVTPAQALAAFRFLERVGSILAPFVVALAVARLGMDGAVLVVGALLALGTLGLMTGLRAAQADGVKHAMA